MKFQSKESKLISSHKTMSVELGLADQKKAIELLYSQYTNPIQTCVQELVCNAFDAMQDAGKSDIPIKVTLPNEINEYYFSVRDYGNSMDTDTIKNVYMRVNASTKSNSNKAIGGFGIGSKTPWAYTDTFILKTFLDGLETQYLMVKGRSKIQIIHSGDTDEPNGVEVMFKTKPNDDSNFAHALRRVSLCAKTKPIFNDNFSLHFDFHEQITPCVSVFKDHTFSKGVYVNIGGVIYRVKDYTNVRNYRMRGTIFDTVNKLLDNSLLITLPIGSVKPMQTRESLFTGGKEGQENKAVLKKVIKYAYNVLSKDLQCRLEKVITPKDTLDFVSKSFYIENITKTFKHFRINNYGIYFNEGMNAFFTQLNRKRQHGWGGATKNVKKDYYNYLSLSEIKKDKFLYSELSPNKARLNKRLYKLAENNQLVVIEKHLLKDHPDLFDEIKELLNAENIENYELPKSESKTNKTKRDTSLIVHYNHRGERIGRIRLGGNLSQKTIVISKDDSFKYSIDILRALGYDWIKVAPTNVQKVLDNVGNTMRDEIPLKAVLPLYIKWKAKKYCDNVQVKNEDLISDFMDANKKKLFTNVDSNVYFYRHSSLVEQLEEKYSNVIQKQAKKIFLRKYRVKTIADKLPLIKCIDEYELDDVAKNDLKQYVQTKLGEKHVK